MSGMKIFVSATVAVVIAVLILFWFLYIETFTASNVDQFDKIQTLTGFIAMIIGTAASIGGSVAALQVANLGLIISRSQEKRDTTQFLEERAGRAIEKFSRLLVSVSEVYSSGILVESRIPHMDKSAGAKKLMDAPMEEALGREVVGLADSIARLIDALRILGQDDFAMFCYTRAAQTLNSKILHLNNGLARLDMERSALTLDISSITDIAAILDIAQKRIRAKETMADIVQARVFTNARDFFGKEYDNRSVRSLFFIGHMIMTMSQRDNQKGAFLACFGAAIIHDLVRIVPDGAFIQSCLKTRYPELSDSRTLGPDFTPSFLVSNFLESALTDAEVIGDLYLLSQ